MPEINYAKVEELQEEFNAAVERKQGVWTAVYEKVEKTGKAAKITGLTRGQSWGIKRTAVARGLRARICEKSTAVIIFPAEE